MLISRKDLPKSRVELTIGVTAREYRHAFGHEIELIAKDTKIEGFRPGKAPAAKVLEKVGRPRVEAAALDHAISDVYYVTLQEAKIVPVSNPDINIVSFTAPGDDVKDDEKVMEFTAAVDVVPDVKVDGYKKISVKAPAIGKVDEKDIDEVIRELREQRSRLEKVAEGTKVENGMWADISFDGSVDGVKREDMHSDAHPIIVGKGQLIPGFEEELIGMKTGEKKTFTITFPKEYHADALKGKKAEFTVGINEVKGVELPELNDEFATSYGQKTLEALRTMIKENLEQERKDKQQAELEELVLAELVKIAKFEVPQSLVETEIDRVIKDNKDRFAKMQVNWEQYLGEIKKTEADLREEMREQAEKNVKIGLAMGGVIKEEGIDSSTEKSMRDAMDALIAIATK